MELTRKQPTAPGYYWWTHGGEHTPTILLVEKEGGKLYAGNGEYGFTIPKKPDDMHGTFDDDGEETEMTLTAKDVEGRPWLYGESLWSPEPIPLPTINGEEYQIDSL